jgi:hypothetical protein
VPGQKRRLLLWMRLVAGESARFFTAADLDAQEVGNETF